MVQYRVFMGVLTLFSVCVVRATQISEKISEEEQIQKFKKELISFYNPTPKNCQPLSVAAAKETSILNQSKANGDYDFIGSFQAHLACMLAGYKDVSEVALLPEHLRRLDQNGVTEEVLASLGIRKYKKENVPDTYYYYTEKGKKNMLLLNKISKEIAVIRKKRDSEIELTAAEEQLGEVAIFIIGTLFGYTESNIRNFYIYDIGVVGKNKLDGYKNIALAWIKENMDTIEKEEEAIKKG